MKEGEDLSIYNERHDGGGGDGDEAIVSPFPNVMRTVDGNNKVEA